VDAQGQSFEPEIEQFSDLLRAAVGETTVAIHWDYAREVLQKANGVIATVGLEAELPTPPEATSTSASTAPASTGPISTTTAATAATAAVDTTGK
jgi:hypothetical protein